MSSECSEFIIRNLKCHDIQQAVQLQSLCFPPPFDAELLWTQEHFESHLAKIPHLQWVAEHNGVLVATCSNTYITSSTWTEHLSWSETVGGPLLCKHPKGDLLYGLDISVHPEFRCKGIASALYQARKELVVREGLKGYVTGCRIPDYGAVSSQFSATEFVERVKIGHCTDRTLSPLLKMGMTLMGVQPDYMDDAESANFAALLEWRP